LKARFNEPKVKKSPLIWDFALRDAVIGDKAGGDVKRGSGSCR
jgi:hypothetical protein